MRCLTALLLISATALPAIALPAAAVAQTPPALGGVGPSEARIEAARVALQPPLLELTDRACVVCALN